MFLATLLAGLVGFLWDKLAFIPWYILIWGQQSSTAVLSVGNAKQQMIFDKSVWRDWPRNSEPWKKSRVPDAEEVATDARRK